MSLSISPLFSDHAILHRSEVVPIWGKAEPGEAVRISFAEQTREAIASPEGRWEVVLDTAACAEGPFELVVESAAEILRAREPVESTWAELREAQTRALALPNTAMAVLIDVGESADIHPRNKRAPGERLARIALAKTYGESVSHSGPIYRSHAVEADCVRLFFDHAEGLQAAPLPACYDIQTLEHRTGTLPIPQPGSPLQGFAICGKDRRWQWGHAVVEGRTVVVHAPRGDFSRSNPLCLGGLPDLQSHQCLRPARLAIPDGRLS